MAMLLKMWVWNGKLGMRDARLVSYSTSVHVGHDEVYVHAIVRGFVRLSCRNVDVDLDLTASGDSVCETFLLSEL